MGGKEGPKMDAEKQFYTVKLPGGCKPDPSMTNRDAMKAMKVDCFQSHILRNVRSLEILH